MVAIGIVILILLSQVSSQRLWCSNSSCTSCLQGYLYFNFMCISKCPSGYAFSSGLCRENSSIILFSFTPGLPLEFNSRSVDKFHHPLGLEFKDPGRQSPIMTKDRGLYFTNSSQLVSNTSWILGPYFSICLSVNIKKKGIIFQILDDDQIIFSISGDQTSFTAEIFFYNLGFNKTEKRTASHEDAWASVCMMIGSYPYGVRWTFGKTYDLKNYEFRGQIEGLKYSFGERNGTAFEGFLYDGYLYNDAKFLKQMSMPSSNCGFNEYTNYKSCVPCNLDCPQWPWCVRSSCNRCYSPDCIQCDNYSKNSCTECSLDTNSSCNPGYKCLDGSHLNCSKCESGYINIKEVCTIPPYKYDPNNLNAPVINTKFKDFQEFYDIFQSGSNSSTYAPYFNPEIDDPYPMVSRGLAFISGKKNYLKSIHPISLSPEFTIAIWVFGFSSGIVFDKETVKTIVFNQAILELVNFEETAIKYTLFYEFNIVNWKLYSICIKVESKLLKILAHYF